MANVTIKLLAGHYMGISEPPWLVHEIETFWQFISDFTSLFSLAPLPHLHQVTWYAENNIGPWIQRFESQMGCLLVYNLTNYLTFLKAFIFAFYKETHSTNTVEEWLMK